MTTVTTAGPQVTLGHSARVAAVTTAVIAVVYVTAAGALDLVLFGRLASAVDQRLAAVLNQPINVSENFRQAANPARIDDAPILLWKVSPQGRATPLSPDAPPLPTKTWAATTPITASLSGGQFRLQARPTPDGWLVAGQSLAGPNRIRADLLTTEALVTPVILLAIYLGSLTIGRKATAPVERIRRRQLEFTADASHELRTPLSVIEAEAELALNAPRTTSSYRTSLQRVAQESKRLHRIVEDLLWLARFDSQPPPPLDEPLDLSPIAAACAERFAPVAGARRIKLSLHHDGTAPALVKAPPEWIDRLVGVLVDNACRYSPPGGTVTLKVGTAGTRTHLVVEDDGPGIPKQEHERLFDRFHRASDQPGGAGLGLAIADAIVRSTRGRWGIGNTPSGGARMEVSWHAGQRRGNDVGPPR